MRCFRQISRRAFSSPARPPLTLPQPKLIATSKLIEEERLPGYDSNDYYPAKPGNVIGIRFQLLVKLGYGISSTTWLARNLQDAYV